MYVVGPRGPKGHNPKTCRCSHCVTGWDNFSSDEEEVNEDYKRVWYSNESDDSDEYDDGYGVGRYAGGKKKNPHVVGKILGTMSQRMYEFNGGLRKKEKGETKRCSFSGFRMVNFLSSGSILGGSSFNAWDSARGNCEYKPSLVILLNDFNRKESYLVI